MMLVVHTVGIICTVILTARSSRTGLACLEATGSFTSTDAGAAGLWSCNLLNICVLVGTYVQQEKGLGRHLHR